MDAPKILIAEDDPEFLKSLGICLARHRLCVIPVCDGYQALDYAIRERPDLMVLDIHMPAGDGFSVHERIVHHPELALKPVIYMTHERTEAMDKAARAHGAFAILYKPFETADLIRLIEDALEQRGLRAA